MKNPKSVFILIFVLLINLCVFDSAFAVQHESYSRQVLHKLGRGLHDVVLSPIEVPRLIYKEFELNGPVASIFAGPFEGLGYMVRRLLVGVYEVVTFPIPQDPILDPEFFTAESFHTNQ